MDFLKRSRTELLSALETSGYDDLRTIGEVMRYQAVPSEPRGGLNSVRYTSGAEAIQAQFVTVESVKAHPCGSKRRPGAVSAPTTDRTTHGAQK